MNVTTAFSALAHGIYAIAAILAETLSAFGWGSAALELRLGIAFGYLALRRHR
jgi:hypothetical protein